MTLFPPGLFRDKLEIMVDEVDELIRAWQQQRPDLPVEAMQIWSRIHRLAMRLDEVRRAAFAGPGLETWEFDVLAALRKAGQPFQLSPSHLVRETHVTSGTMTNRIDRLETRGLVARESHPNDGRGVLVALTPEGRELVDEALTNLVWAENKLMAGITVDDRDCLNRALRNLLQMQAEPDPAGQVS